MRTIIRTNFDSRSHDTIVEEYCSGFRGKVAIAPQSFERLYVESDEIIFEGEDGSPETLLDYPYERSETQGILPGCSSRASRNIQYVVVVPVLISYRADGEATRMWDEGPSAEPPHRI